MKKILISFLLIVLIENLWSQNLIQKSGCVQMLAESYVTNTGANYNAWIENNYSKYVHVNPSLYEVTFKKLSSSGKEGITRNKIKFKEAFIAPEKSLYRDRSRYDNSSITYLDVKSEYGTLGTPSYISLAVPEGYADKPTIQVGYKTLIGYNGNLKVYAELKPNFWASWPGFEQYKVKITAVNTAGQEFKDVIIDYTINFYGHLYHGSEKFNKIKVFQTKEKTKVIDPIFNFNHTGYLKLNSKSTVSVPDYNEIEITNSIEQQQHEEKIQETITKTVFDLEKIKAEITTINTKIDAAVENMDFKTAANLKNIRNLLEQMKIAVEAEDTAKATELKTQIETLGYEIDVETQVTETIETDVVQNENNQTEVSTNTNKEETQINNEAENKISNENNQTFDKTIVNQPEINIANKEEVNLNGHYLSIGSGSSYGYFGVNWQYRKGIYAFSAGLGALRIAVGNKLYLSKEKKALRDLYFLANLGYDFSIFEYGYYDSYSGIYFSEYYLKGLFSSFLVGYNHQWQKEKVALGLNVGLGLEVFSLDYAPTSSIAYDLGFVIKF